METCKSVRVIHDILHRLDFIYLVELFRFFGILVCEDILTEEEKGKKAADTDYDAVIYVGRKEITEKQADLLHIAKEKYQNLVNEICSDAVWFYDCVAEVIEGPESGSVPLENEGYPLPVGEYLNNGQQVALYGSILKKVLKEGNYTGCGPVPDNLWESLVGICIENKLMFHSMNLQYYAKLPSEAAGDAKNAFIAAYKQLGTYEETYKDNMHYRYARIWCAMKANLACDFQDDILYFRIDKLAEKCEELCRDCKEFDNAKVLLGLCYEPSAANGNQALMAFDSALEGFGKACFTSSVYYWMGKRFESFGKKEDAEICYRRANDRKEKFRNYFKLAIYERDRKEYQKSLELFQTILSRLERKRRMDFADPLELEYAFKVCTQECYIYYQMGDYDNAIQMGERAIDIREKEIESSKFFRMFYGNNEYLKYEEILKKRLRLRSAFRILLEIYGVLQDKEKKEEYQRKLVDLDDSYKIG